MAELKNCKHCGDVFAAVAGRSICQKCYHKEEEDFQTVYHFLTKRKNREATIDEIVAVTEVDQDLIIKFMQQNRLRPAQFPNLSYACERCSTSITKGHLCGSCSGKIQSALRQHEELEKKQREKENVEPIYYTMKKKKQ